ncbi:gamma-glutamyltransferase [Algivirga pacifica]|uniref:Glutathione hydrolase proenzyme n=1 Tax=Algivirga pacifica TaxID=1162670 RepID=A0ABP9D613_9BACT
MFQFRTIIGVLFFTLLFQGCKDKIIEGSIGTKGVVSTAHPLATKIGIDILNQGGNAYDAAIGIQFALAVAYPRAGNIGGGGFMVSRHHDGTVQALDFREKAPAQAHETMYQDSLGNIIENISLKGHMAVGVPGSVDGMVKIHQRYGSLPWEQLLAPAIKLAQEGVPLTLAEAEKINVYQDEFTYINSHRIPLINETGWNKGDTIFYPELAQTLQRIQENQSAGFYSGETAQLIVEEMQGVNRGIITLEDLKNYQAVWRAPIQAPYKNYTIISMPPPSSGGIALAQLMQGAETFPLKSMEHNTAAYIHTLVELERRVYADRSTHLGDPDFYEVPQEMLLSKEYIQERNRSINPEKKTPSQDIKAGEVERIESFETTHFSVVDQEGNAVAITTTLNSNFGSKVMVKGGGFFLNNEMDDFSVKPGVANQFGLIGGKANAIAAGKRMLSSMTPTIVERDDKLFMVVGTPGGSTIITSVFQTILNVIEFEMNMQEAVNAKKFHSQWLPDKVYMELGVIDQKTAKALKNMGHDLDSVEGLGRMDCILIREDGSKEAASDYLRGDGKAMAQ